MAKVQIKNEKLKSFCDFFSCYRAILLPSLFCNRLYTWSVKHAVWVSILRDIWLCSTLFSKMGTDPVFVERIALCERISLQQLMQ